jgi:hypothetical protein
VTRRRLGERTLDLRAAPCAYRCAYRLVSERCSSWQLAAATKAPVCSGFQLLAALCNSFRRTLNPKVEGSNPGPRVLVVSLFSQRAILYRSSPRASKNPFPLQASWSGFGVARSLAVARVEGKRENGATGLESATSGVTGRIDRDYGHRPNHSERAHLRAFLGLRASSVWSSPRVSSVSVGSLMWPEEASSSLFNAVSRCEARGHRIALSLYSSQGFTSSVLGNRAQACFARLPPPASPGRCEQRG